MIAAQSGVFGCLLKKLDANGQRECPTCRRYSQEVSTRSGNLPFWARNLLGVFNVPEPEPRNVPGLR
jgi:hypothetical protein